MVVLRKDPIVEAALKATSGGCGQLHPVRETYDNTKSALAPNIPIQFPVVRTEAWHYCVMTTNSLVNDLVGRAQS